MVLLHLVVRLCEILGSVRRPVRQVSVQERKTRYRKPAEIAMWCVMNAVHTIYTLDAMYIAIARAYYRSEKMADSAGPHHWLEET